MTQRIAFSSKALKDLDDMWLYTLAHWGIDQAEFYTRQIRAVTEVLAADPERGRACDEIGAHYRKYSVGSHMIFYREIKDSIEIVRILHQSRDFVRHF